MPIGSSYATTSRSAAQPQGAGAIAESCRCLNIPVHVLIRPRAGDFCYSESELAAIRQDIGICRSLGAAGVVFGVLTNEAAIDHDRTAELIALARPLSVTFHKAFDQTPDLLEALDNLITLGVDRVLTSGGHSTALKGVETLAALVERAAGRITIMAGGRLGFDNLAAVIRQASVSEVHLGSAVSRIVHGTTLQPRDGFDNSWNQTDPERVAAVVRLVRGLGSSRS